MKKEKGGSSIGPKKATLANLSRKKFARKRKGRFTGSVVGAWVNRIRLEEEYTGEN